MIQYIYFVKCPNCEDEHFDFFDEAKEFALGCLGNKPIITQVEVCRNDFGECTDSSDLGTIWSWEDVTKVSEDDPAVSVFTLDDFKDPGEDDPEFAALDNSVDFVPETSGVSAIDDIPDNFRRPIPEDLDRTGASVDIYTDYDLLNLPIGTRIAVEDMSERIHTAYALGQADNTTIYVTFNESDRFNTDTNYFQEISISNIVRVYDDDIVESFSRKPIPEGMTIEQLVEEMEENEDIVECAWCNELFDKSECRKEVDLGWLCSRCEAAIKSRGETLTFRENNYWDFLDEDISLTEAVYRNIINLPDAKDQILEIAKLDASAVHYINNDNTINSALAKSTSGGEIGYVTDFIVNDRGELILTLDRGNNRFMELELDNLMNGGFFPRGLQRTCPAYILLRALRNAARELNRRVGVAGGRNLNAVANVRDNPEAAEELRNHIVNIRYEIPLGDYTADDFSEDPDNAEKAAENLASIKANFFAWQYGDAAEAAGLVVDRVIRDEYDKLKDSVFYISTEWHAIGKITFDCSIDQLSEDAQNLIRASKVSGSFDKIKHKKEIDCIRLAKALTAFFDNVLFYQDSDVSIDAKDSSISEEDMIRADMAYDTARDQKYFGESAEPKSMLEELEDTETYLARLTLCPECGKDSFDKETGICINCGFNTF